MDPLRGKTVRWTISDGSAPATSYEHVFAEDGSVEWRILDGAAKGHSARETKYSAVQVSPNVIVTSYLAASGHTLTAVLNMTDHRVVGYASGHDVWHTFTGPFEIVR